LLTIGGWEIKANLGQFMPRERNRILACRPHEGGDPVSRDGSD
jgi:hypothetical protein